MHFLSLIKNAIKDNYLKLGTLIKNKFVKYFVLFIVFLTLIIIWGHTGLEIHNYSLSSTPLSENEAYILDFPGNANTNYTYSATIIKKYFFQNTLKFYPDDCIQKIEINKQSIDLSKYTYDKDGLCNYQQGVDIDIGKYIKYGENLLEATVVDNGGSVGLKVMASNIEPSYFYTEICIFIFLLFFFYCLSIDIKISKISLVVFMISLSLYFGYFFKTEWFMRGHDLHGHIPYIEYIVKNLKLPLPTECWECHQQPIYYIILAIFTKILNFALINDKMFIYKAMSLISLTFFAGYLKIGIKIFENIFERNIIAYLSILIFLFWPSNILHSNRIGNDQLTYLSIALSILYTLKYIKSRKKKDFYFSVVTSIIASLTKLTAFAIVPIPFVILFLVNIGNFITNFKIEFQNIKSNALEYMLFTIFLIISLLFIFHYPLTHGFTSDWLTINKPGDTMLVSNTIYNFVYIDIPTFLKVENINTFIQNSGSEFFLHTLLKTSLFGEFQINNPNNLFIANMMSITFLISIISITWGIFQIKISRISLESFAMSIYFLILFASLIYFRYKMPYTPNQDFRYILPILIPIIYLINKVSLNQFKRLSGFIILSSIILINLFSILFFYNIIIGYY